jgi:virulence factor Mce-like protein
MVGAVTTLIVIVAVFLAYNANSGLPFVPSYRLSAELPDARALVPGNEVRIGGVRVGLVETIEAQQTENGDVNAELTLKLDPDIEPLPVDSTMIVRARSALGLKYLEIVQGTSDEGYPRGATIPASAATPEPVEFDEFLSTFDEPTQIAMQENLVEFGNALGGRGVQLNEVIGRLPAVLEYLEPVMTNLSSPETGLDRFVSALAATAAEVGPVAEQQAQSFVSLDTTFAAFAAVARPYIQETISESPPTLDVATETFPKLRPFLEHSAALFTDLQPGVEALRVTSPVIAQALEIGAPILRDSPKLNEEIPPLAAALRALNDSTDARAGIDRLTETAEVLDPTLDFIAPAQTVCNYASILFGNAASLYSQGNQLGTWQRTETLISPVGPNNEGSPSTAPADGGGTDIGNYLHTNPYPNTAAPGQERECEAGNEPYEIQVQRIGNVPGNQGTTTGTLEVPE